jgi:hypothetical protein
MVGTSEDESRFYGEPTLQEINAKIPRKVYLYDGQVALVFALLLLGFGAIWFGGAFYIYFVHQARQRDALNHYGREALGAITKIHLSAGRGGGTLVDYAFRVDGSDYRDTINLDYEPFSPDGDLPYLHVGEQIPVQYLPSDPRVHHPSGWAWWSWWEDVFPELFFLLFPIGGAVFAVQLFRDWRLARLGRVVEGKVTGCAKNHSVFTIYYEFLTPNNDSVEGSSDSSDEYQYGSRIRVIYLPKHPKRNDIYPMSSFHAVA